MRATLPFWLCLMGCGALDEAQSSRGQRVAEVPSGVASQSSAMPFAAVIASTDQPALALTIDATNVYWTAGSSVLQCSKVGCTTPTVLATDIATVQWVAVDGTSVDWITREGSAVARCAIGGCYQSPVVIPYQNVWDIAAAAPGARWAGGSYAVETSDVYWVSGKALLTCELGSCTGAAHQVGSGVLTDFAVGPRIAVDAASVYWHDLAGDIVRCAKPGCTAPSVVAHVPGITVRDLASDGEHVYWAESGTIHRVSVNGSSQGDVVFAADGDTVVNRLALDGARLWFTTAGAKGGSVVAVTK